MKEERTEEEKREMCEKRETRKEGEERKKGSIEREKRRGVRREWVIEGKRSYLEGKIS